MGRAFRSSWRLGKGPPRDDSRRLIQAPCKLVIKLAFLSSISYSYWQASWISEEDKAIHHAEFGANYTPALNWYRRAISNLGFDAEVSALADKSISAMIHVPTLMINGTNDRVCKHGRPTSTMEACVEDGKLSVKDIDAGHWIMLEKKVEFNEALEEWLVKTNHKSTEKAGL